MSRSDDKLISTGWHFSYGWMRRSDMDGGNGYCYEEPNGKLVYSTSRRHKTMMRLERYEDKNTGYRYTVFADAKVQK